MDTSLARGRRLLALRAVQYGLAFLSTVIIARALGPHGRAAYALPLNLAAIIWVCVHLSVEVAVARLVARREATFDELARVGVTTAIVMGAVGGILTLAIGLPLRDELLGGASTMTLLLAAGTIAPSIAGQVSAALLFRRGVLLRYGVVQAAQALAQLGLLAAFALGDALTPQATLAINLALMIASTATLMIMLRAELGGASMRPTFDRALLARVARVGLVLHASSLALYLNLRLDLLLVGAILDLRRAGAYSLAVMLAELGAVAISTLSLAALKRQTDLPARAAVEFTSAFVRRTLRWSVLYALGASLASYPVIRFAYGPEWTVAVAPFILLSVAVVALSIEAPARGMLIRIGRPWKVSAASVTGLVVNLILLLALLRPLGLVGAAISSIFSYWISAGLMVLLLRQARRTLLPPSVQPLPPS
jgi:O-antigen/teichoic acid export membrane protein